MAVSYFKVGVRNLLRKRNYTIINILGLAVGIAVCMIIFIIIQFHTSFENFHSKKDRIYRIVTESQQTDTKDITTSRAVPFPLPQGLRAAFPDLEQVAPVYASHNDQLQVLDAGNLPVKNFSEKSGVFYTSPSFFKIFDFPLLAGSYSSLEEPNNVLLTKETAMAYFGDWKNAIGRVIKLTGSYRIGSGLFQSPPVTLKVSGILATIPQNTDFQLKLVIAYGTDFTGDKVYGYQNPDWSQSAPDFGCYVLLPEGVSAKDFNRKLAVYARKVQPADNKDNYAIQAIDDIHYDAQAGSYSSQVISHKLLNVLWLIGLFILVIACINFINLATAQSVNRAKEVAVRKVLGSNRYQLQLQFIIETFLIVTSAVLLASLITIFVIPTISRLLALPLTFDLAYNSPLILFLVVITVVVTALAGFYPSIVLSRFNPVNALKSKVIVNSSKGISLRRAMVVFQFVVAQILIIGTLIIIKQTHYFLSQPLGFDKDAIINVPFRPDSTGTVLTDYLKHQLLAVNGIQGVSFSATTPIEKDDDLWTTFKVDPSQKEAGIQTIVKFADDKYAPTYKLQLVAGRNLKPSGYTQEFLVNESLVKRLGYKNAGDILNKEVAIWNGQIKCPVVGVLKDFNDRTLRDQLAPLVVTTNNTMYRQASIKLSLTNISATLKSVERIWERTLPDLVFDYKFLDEKIAGFYRQEMQLSQLYKIFAAIAIFISCLGLYGLVSFVAVQRVKEIGIRKVFGANTASIIYLFFREFITLIVIAFAIAAPIAFYCMHRWLQDYAYRIKIGWWLFVFSGLAAIFIALVAISFQILKAARVSPVRSLRAD